MRPAMLPGLLILVLGGALDALAHAAPGVAPVGERAAHLVTFAGMLLSLAGLAPALVGRKSQAERSREACRSEGS